MRSHDYADVLSGPRRPTVSQVTADPGLVVEDAASGFCGAVIRIEAGTVVLADRHDKHRTFPLDHPGFLLEGTPVRLTRPRSSASQRPSMSASGSVRVDGQRARTARASRIWVEGTHDAELVERVWGHDLRVEGVVVEPLGGIDDLDDRIAEFAPAAHRRVGVLVDHLVDGSKESRIVDAVDDANVLVTGHPYVDIWQAVRPAALGIERWPDIPKSESWKDGVCARLGWGTPPEGWRRVLSAVSSFRDVEPALIGAIERLIDFVTVSQDD